MTNILLAGEIMTTADFRDVEKAMEGLDKNSLVLFDVDDTLIVPCDAILRPKGKKLFYQLIRQYDGDFYREILIQARHSLVDKESVHLVQKLQRNHIPVIAFTAATAKTRGTKELGMWRVEELKNVGFDFRSAFPDVDVLEFTKADSKVYFPLFKSGVLYTSLHSKGDILTSFIQQLKLNPNKVVFVDDKLYFVKSVVKALDQLGIPCLGIHYTAAEKYPCEVNEKRATYQVHYFIENNIWLDDNHPLLFQFSIFNHARCLM